MSAFPTPDLIWRSNQFGFLNSPVPALLLFHNNWVFTFLLFLYWLLLHHQTLPILYVNRKPFLQCRSWIHKKKHPLEMSPTRRNNKTTVSCLPVSCISPLALEIALPTETSNLCQVSIESDEHISFRQAHGYYDHIIINIFTTTIIHLYYYRDRLTERTNRPTVRSSYFLFNFTE